MSLHSKLLRQSRAAALPLTLTLLMGILGGLLVTLQARQLSGLVARVFLGGQDLAQVATLLAGLLGIFLLRSVAVFVAEWAAAAVAVRVKNNLRELLAQKLIAMGPAKMGQERSGELVTTVLQGVEALDAYFSQYLPQIVLSAVVPLVILLFVFPLDLLSALILLLTAPLIPVFMVLIGQASAALTRRQFTALSRMGAFFLDTIQGLTTLKTLGQSQKQHERIARVSDQYRAATMSVLRVTFLSALVLELAATLSTAVIAVQIGLRLMYGQLGFEQAFFILIIAPEFYLPLRQLGLRFHAGMAGLSAAGRIFEVLDSPLPPGDESTDQPMTVMLKAPLTVRFEQVRYRYAGRESDAVAGVSFDIRPGEQVALVGATGSGKSTLANLLLGFLTPQEGQIQVNGRRLAEVGVENWRQQIAWVSQQPYLLNDSIANNIRIANEEASSEQIRAAARLAGLDDWIVSLPHGYDTPAGELGARLSGGQAQRLALARAFLKDAPMLILDEPTAHLDPEQEQHLQAITTRLRQGRTVLTIAHRLPTVMEADRILVMDRGKIIESGTHSELLARDGLYARLVRVYGGAQ